MSGLRRSGRAANITVGQALGWSLGIHIALIVLLIIVGYMWQQKVCVVMRPPSEVKVVCVPSWMVPSQQRVRSKKPQRSQKNTDKPQVVAAPAKKVPKGALPDKAVVKAQAIVIPMEPQKNARAHEKKGLKQKKPVAKKAITEETSVLPLENKKNATVPEVSEPKSEIATVSESLASESDVLYVNQETYDGMELSRAVYDAIAAHWQPPMGIKGLCEIEVLLHAKGTVVQAKVHTTSGAALYDMAARQAVLHATYPQAVWGKTLIVQFT